MVEYATGTYVDIDDALDELVAFAKNTGTAAYNWTQNGTTDAVGVPTNGYRAHLQKTIGSVTAYINLRSVDGTVGVGPEYGCTGICVNGSTGYNASNDWDEQPGYTTEDYTGTTTSAAGLVDDIKASGGTYHFFATATTFTAVFETESLEDDWRMMTFGTVGGYLFYAASGGVFASTGSTYDHRSRFFANVPSGTPTGRNNHTALYIPTEGWYNARDEQTGTSQIRIVSNIVSVLTTLDSDMEGSTVTPIVAFTPDLFKGNAQLAPSLVTITRGSTNEYWPIGEIEGVKFINMTNYSNEDDITYDTDTYKLFRIYNPSPTGVAFLKEVTP